jgi:hypothetical protein
MHERVARMAKLLGWAGALVTAGAAVAALVSGAGYEHGFWDYRTGFAILRWSVYTAAGAGAVALVGCALGIVSRRYRIALVAAAGVAVAAALILPSAELQRRAEQVPRIHDITTDTQDPPQFVSLLAVRQKSPNGPEYGGEAIARAQKAAYPDIQPRTIDDALPQAYARALAAARNMGWEIVATAPDEGRIEATATTRWFRFKDDVVIRVTPRSVGSRIDVRSKSRVGRSDLGTNAKRIRAYFQALDATR